MEPNYLIFMTGDSKNNEWLVVVNVFAASKKAGSVWKKAALMLEEAGVSYQALFTGGRYNASQLSFNAAKSGYRRFLAVGGDGTVHDVLNGIAEYVESSADVTLAEFTLGVLPVGSGNDWVKSTGVPRDIQGAVNAIAKADTSRQDVVKVVCEEGVSYMANVGGVGLDARVCEIVNRKKVQGKRGKKLYVGALLYCIKHRVPIRARVVCDGKAVFEGKYLSIAFGIGKYSGGGMSQTPLAEIGDGLLDVTVIPDIPMWTIIKEVSKLFTGTFHKISVLTMAKCREVEVLPYGKADAEPVEVDGEVTGRVPVKMTVLPDSINVIVG